MENKLMIQSLAPYIPTEDEYDRRTILNLYATRDITIRGVLYVVGDLLNTYAYNYSRVVALTKTKSFTNTPPSEWLKMEEKNLKKLIHFSKVYLPYDVLISNGTSTPITLTVNNFNSQIDNSGKKMILRPLSDLTKEISHNGTRFVPKDEINQYTKTNADGTLYLLVGGDYWESCPLKWDYQTVEQLLSRHFDIYGLIGDGLAIDINMIKV